jgi:hypothetical protein
VPENGFQLFEFQRRRNAKHSSFAIKTAIGQEAVAVGIESEEVAEGLDGNDRAGDWFLFRYGLLDKNLQGFPGAAAETGKKLSIIQEVTAENLWDAEDEMTVGHLFEDIHAEPLPEFHHALLMAGRTEMPSFTRKGQQVFMAAVFAFNPGKAVAQIAAIEITVTSPHGLPTINCTHPNIFWSVYHLHNFFYNLFCKKQFLSKIIF